MRAKSFFILLFLTIGSLNLSADPHLTRHEYWLQTLASLTYHTRQLCDEIKQQEAGQFQDKEDSSIAFSNEDVFTLWTEAANYVYGSENKEARELEIHFEDAYGSYQQGLSALESQQLNQAEEVLETAATQLGQLWQDACTQELEFAPGMKAQTNHDFETNAAISAAAKRHMRPYIIPNNHPKKRVLDALFASRVTLNAQTLAQAGFNTISVRPRSYIRVISHPALPNYLIKCNLDSEIREKHGKSSWFWLVRRCEGVQQVQNVIDRKKIKHFVAAKKWIYPLPAEPAPPRNGLFRRHYAVLLVTDMQLAPEKKNYYAWRHYITKEHLRELYTIISRAKGSSYRPDNIAYTIHDQFAFIDTEYPQRKPDYDSIRKYLNPEMRKYWDRLVKQGGRG